MTTANKITLTRIAMIPFFIYFAAQPMLIIDETRYLAAFPTSTVIALVLFCVASFTDFLDGYVARKYNQVTDFGKFVDPLADKLLVASAGGRYLHSHNKLMMNPQIQGIKRHATCAQEEKKAAHQRFFHRLRPPDKHHEI